MAQVHDLTKKKQDLADILEQQIDRYTLTVVLDALEEVCFMKAQHLEENWQDKASAKAWHDAAMRLDRTRQFASDRQI